MESAASTRVGTRDQDLRSWLLILVLVAGHGIKHMYASGFLLILPEMRLGLALSNSDLGTLATARNLAGSLMNLPAGFLADRSSKQWPMILGITMISIGTLQFIMGTVSSYWPIVICAIFAGASISLWHPAAIAALSQRFADRRGLVISLHGTGGSIGEALGPLVVGGALLWLVWQTVLQASLFPALIGGGLVWWLMRNVQGQGTGTLTMQDYVASLKLLFRTRGLQTVLIVTGLYSFAQGGFVTFLPVYLRIDLEYSTFQAAAFIAAAQVSGIISQPIMGWLSDRFGRAMVLAPSLMLLGIGILCVAFVPAGWPLAVTVTLLGAFQFPNMALFLATAMDLVKREVQATTVALVFGMSFVSGSISPLIAGRLGDTFGLQSAFIYSAVGVLCASLYLFIRRSSLTPVPEQLRQ